MQKKEHGIKCVGREILVLIVFYICFVSGCNVPGTQRHVQDISGLAIEICIPKDRYSLEESVDADIVFRNNGNKTIKLAMIEGSQEKSFFDFLLLGNMGREYITNNSEDWFNPGAKSVQMVPLGPGEDFKVHLKNILPFHLFSDLGVHPQEQFELRAIYRDHAYGHAATYEEFGKDDPAVWRGIVISNPVKIESITRTTGSGSR